MSTKGDVLYSATWQPIGSRSIATTSMQTPYGRIRTRQAAVRTPRARIARDGHPLARRVVSRALPRSPGRPARRVDPAGKPGKTHRTGDGHEQDVPRFGGHRPEPVRPPPPPVRLRRLRVVPQLARGRPRARRARAGKARALHAGGPAARRDHLGRGHAPRRDPRRRQRGGRARRARAGGDADADRTPTRWSSTDPMPRRRPTQHGAPTCWSAHGAADPCSSTWVAR